MGDPEMFLRALYGALTGGCVNVRLLGQGRPRNLYRPLPLGDAPLQFDTLTRLNQSENIYIRIGVSAAQRSRKIDITTLTALWCDVDSADRSALDAVRPRPNMLVSSGRGWHGYWLLDAPLPVTDENRVRIEQVLHGIALAARADVHCRDVSRILRLPGFFNRKPEYADSPPLCRIVHLDDSPLMRVSWQEMWETFAPLAAPIMPRLTRPIPAEARDSTLPAFVRDYLLRGAPAGERNATLFRCACRYRDHGLTESQADVDLGGRAAADGLPQHEITSVIRSAYRQPISPVLPRHMTMVAAMEDHCV